MLQVAQVQGFPGVDDIEVADMWIRSANITRYGKFVLYRQAICKPSRTKDGKYFNTLHSHVYWLMELRPEFLMQCALLNEPPHVRHIRDRNVSWKQEVGCRPWVFRPGKPADVRKRDECLRKQEDEMVLRARLLAEHLMKYKRNPLAVAYEREKRKPAEFEKIEVVKRVG